MSEKRFFVKVYSSNEPFFFDTKQKYFEQGYTCDDVVLKPMSVWQVVDLLNELFEHNLHLQRLIESLAKCTGESIEDTIARCQEKKEIYTTSKRPMRFVGGRKV